MAAEPKQIITDPVCAIDLGTFSALILVAAVRRGRLVALHEERRTIDLFRDATGRLTQEGVRRAQKILSHFGGVAKSYGVERGMVAATAAIRTASNRREVEQQLRKRLDFPVRVISQRKEALWSAMGATIGLRGLKTDSIIVDVGGGSTELINTSTGAVAGLAIGAATATSQWEPTFPRLRTLRDLEFTLKSEQAFLPLRPRRLGNHSRVIGVGGTASTLAAIKVGLSKFDPNQVHGVVLSYEWIAALASVMTQMTRSELRALVPFDPSRSRVLCAGTYLWCGVLNRLNADRVTVSARGLRWGIAAHLTGLQ